MAKLIVNPVTGELDNVRSDEEILELAGATPSTIEDGTNKITTDSSQMISGGDTMIANAGSIQLIASGSPVMQILSDQMRISSSMSQRRERWRLNTITSSNTSLVNYFNKVTMAATGQSIQLFTGNNNGYYVLVYKDGGEEFNVTIGTGGLIKGHGTSVTIKEDGESILLHQAETGVYTVISHHIPSQSIVLKNRVDTRHITSLITTNTFVNFIGLDPTKYYKVKVSAVKFSGSNSMVVRVYNKSSTFSLESDDMILEQYSGTDSDASLYGETSVFTPNAENEVEVFLVPNGTTIYGDTNRKITFVELIELNDVETASFT